MSRRGLALGAGSALAIIPFLPPLGGLAQHLLVGHILQSVILLAGASPLLVYGWEPPASVRRLLDHPVHGLLAVNLALVIWLLPGVAAASAHYLVVSIGLGWLYLAGAVTFWWPLIRSVRLSGMAKIGYLLLAGVPPTIPGLVMALSRHLFYTGYAAGRPGLSPLEDQQAAGLLLFGTAKFILVGCMFVILWRMFAAAEQDHPPDEPPEDRPLPPSPPSMPAWLDRLSDRLPQEPAPSRRPVAGAGQTRGQG
jgi:putative membrane protein